MRIILDTNVLISAFVFRGICERIYLYCTEYEEAILSEYIIKELLEKLEQKFDIEEDKLLKVKNSMHEDFIIALPDNPLPGVCRDPDDNYILQLAQYVEADYIITGDKDLLVLQQFEGTIIVSPRDFNDLIPQP